MLPRSFPINSSLDGIVAISLIPSWSYVTPSTTPAFNSSFGAVLEKLCNILAGAVASSFETAIAVGPSSELSSVSNGVPLAA